MDARYPISRHCSWTKLKWSYPTAELPPVFTIGHSTRSIAQFGTILVQTGIETIVDVRSVPRSRTNPQFNFDIIGGELDKFKIGYCRIAELGGRRPRSHGVPAQLNGYWINQSFHNYADYALSFAFADGLARLNELSMRKSLALMCAEAVWWRCHRRIIADYLLFHGREVVHLMGEGRSEIAKMNPAAKERDGNLVYPALLADEGSATLT